nr:MAG TPA: hypothetical protein [Bacteriophage sp.]
MESFTSVYFQINNMHSSTNNGVKENLKVNGFRQ